MLDENRYCGDILIQIAAVEKALESFGYIVLSNHLKTCVTQDVLDGKNETMDEVMDMIKKLK
jgi:DNA-binding FrmR family transcriptional regulator